MDWRFIDYYIISSFIIINSTTTEHSQGQKIIVALAHHLDHDDSVLPISFYILQYEHDNYWAVMIPYAVELYITCICCAVSCGEVIAGCRAIHHQSSAAQQQQPSCVSSGSLTGRSSTRFLKQTHSQYSRFPRWIGVPPWRVVHYGRTYGPSD